MDATWRYLKYLKETGTERDHQIQAAFKGENGTHIQMNNLKYST